MDFTEYQRLAQRTSNTRLAVDKLFNGALGLSGESGEVADLVKKYMYQGHTLNDAEIINECGDVLWYIAEIATAFNVSLEDIAVRNIEKLKKRYPDGFDSTRSIDRGTEK